VILVLGLGGVLGVFAWKRRGQFKWGEGGVDSEKQKDESGAGDGAGADAAAGGGGGGGMGGAGVGSAGKTELVAMNAGSAVQKKHEVDLEAGGRSSENMGGFVVKVRLHGLFFFELVLTLSLFLLLLSFVECF
jgi:hypothetical protein